MFKKLKQLFLGKAINPTQAGIFHQLSLVAFMAWVGLGADGLSSSSYGPEELFRALGPEHTHLAFYLAIATAITVFIIAFSYMQIIKLFPAGGGGYVVASKFLGSKAGVVSGTALIVDYILTISLSIAAGVDAIFSFLPPDWVGAKVATAAILLLVLIWMNMRGLKESIQVLMPIFIIFLVTHVILLSAGIFGHANGLPVAMHATINETQQTISQIGWLGLLALLLRAYSLGAGTYTGIEAVSNGMSTLREPRVQTGHRTMLYMAISLAITAGGILLSYMLWDVRVLPDNTQTLNAVLTQKVLGGWQWGSWPIGQWLLYLTLISEALLLFIAAQTGFVGGPTVLANMAVDSWVPHRFGDLSDRLVRTNGILFMGLTSVAILILAKGSVHVMVVLYSINVFITFSLSQLGTCLHWWKIRKTDKQWVTGFIINGIGLILTSLILVVTTVLKFTQGGWLTLVITGGLIGLCAVVKLHYTNIRKALGRLDELLTKLTVSNKHPVTSKCDPALPTAVLLVSGYNGLGIHSIFSIRKLFQDKFKNFIFISVGRVDSSRFKGIEEIENLKLATEKSLKQYVQLAQNMGYAADYRYVLGTDVIEESEKMCDELALKFSDPIFFAGKLIFAKENFFSKILHNQTALEIQRRLLFKGNNMVIVPIRVL
jgi:amino acid transporter